MTDCPDENCTKDKDHKGRCQQVTASKLRKGAKIVFTWRTKK